MAFSFRGQSTEQNEAPWLSLHKWWEKQLLSTSLRHFTSCHNFTDRPHTPDPFTEPSHSSFFASPNTLTLIACVKYPAKAGQQGKLSLINPNWTALKSLRLSRGKGEQCVIKVSVLPHDKICLIYLFAAATLFQDPTVSHHGAFLQWQLEGSSLATQNKTSFTEENTKHLCSSHSWRIQGAVRAQSDRKKTEK